MSSHQKSSWNGIITTYIWVNSILARFESNINEKTPEITLAKGSSTVQGCEIADTHYQYRHDDNLGAVLFYDNNGELIPTGDWENAIPSCIVMDSSVYYTNDIEQNKTKAEIAKKVNTCMLLAVHPSGDFDKLYDLTEMMYVDSEESGSETKIQNIGGTDVGIQFRGADRPGDANVLEMYLPSSDVDIYKYIPQIVN